MNRKLVIASFLFACFVAGTAFSQQKTKINHAQAKTMLLGRHMLSLQWISWVQFGAATAKEKSGVLTLEGRQKGRGNTDFLSIDGVIVSVDAKEFAFKGKIVMQVSHINNGEPCVRQGEFTFRITGKRKYWRLQEMDNPCDEATDYVDIYFR